MVLTTIEIEVTSGTLAENINAAYDPVGAS